MKPYARGCSRRSPTTHHLGLEVLEVGRRPWSRAAARSQALVNHVGSQHAGALFSAGEAASGAAFVGAFAEQMGGITPLARSAQIDYRKLAKGPITATGTLSEDKDSLLGRLESEGKVEFQVEVDLADSDGTSVAQMSVDWHVRRNQRGP